MDKSLSGLLWNYFSYISQGDNKVFFLKYFFKQKDAGVQDYLQKHLISDCMTSLIKLKGKEAYDEFVLPVQKLIVLFDEQLAELNKDLQARQLGRSEENLIYEKKLKQYIETLA